MQENEKKFCDIIFMDTVTSTETEWLWYPYIPRGKLTIIQGDPGEGKSTFALYLAAMITRGTRVDAPNIGERAPALVCYQNAEDGLRDTVKPRLERAGAFCDMVFSADESREPSAITDGRIEMMMREYHPALLILDPLQAYLGSDVDMHRANEIRPIMSYLAALAEQYNCAVVLVGHMNKMQKTRSLYRGLGSIDLTAAARSVLLIARDPSHPENRVITQIKNSLAQEGERVAFTLDEDGKVKWLGKYEITMEELLGQENRGNTRQSEAEALILEMMPETGVIAAKDVIEEAKRRGISDRTITRCRKILGIRAVKTPDGWLWQGKRTAEPVF